jgi:pimeloyl-ACP methyl ester carboxylesterase
MDIPYFENNKIGVPLHFLHANGYPPGCYKPLFEFLQTQYHVFGMLLRPLWPESMMQDMKDWRPFSDDLLTFLSARGTDPVVGVGHSVGGIVTLRTALLNPDKFRAIVLLDPVLFVPSFLFMWNFIRALGLGYRLHPMISGTLKRRRTFDDLDLVFRGYRSRAVFRYMHDDSLKTYISGITKPMPGGGYELTYSPEWESRIYLTGLRDTDLWRNLPKLKVPALIIRGAESDTFLENAANLVHQKQPDIKIVTLEKSTHLLPLEQPQEVFDIMQSFLQEVL